MDLKIQVLLLYYMRPLLLKNALKSITENTYENWEVAFIDDSSEIPGQPIVEETVPLSSLQKFRFYWTGDTTDNKVVRGGSIFGKFMNQAMAESDADVTVMLCDDDGFKNDYFAHLNKYYYENPEVIYSYSHLILFNPLVDDFDEVKTRTEASNYLRWTEPINPFCMVDSSQVSWVRTACMGEGAPQFPFPQTRNLDASFYSQMFNKYGPCVFNGYSGILKGWGDFQLGQRPIETQYQVEGQ